MHFHRTLLEQGPQRLRALLAGLPDVLLDTNDGGATWTPRQVAGHMADAEHQAWMPRLRIMMAGDDTTVLPTFDRDAHLTRYAEAHIDTVLEDFAAMRTRNLSELEVLLMEPGGLERRAVHSAFGPVAVRQLIATWATHDWAHFTQITRTIARAQREAVGPWTAFLSVFAR